MKLRTTTANLFAKTVDGELTFVGHVEKLDLEIVAHASGRVNFNYPWPTYPVGVVIALDVDQRAVRATYRDWRWETLRRQARCKRRPGWRAIKARRGPLATNYNRPR